MLINGGDHFGRRPHVVCGNNNYVYAAYPHDGHLRRRRIVPCYQFAKNIKIEPFTAVEKSCKRIIMEQTFDDFTIEDLITAGRNADYHSIIFRHELSMYPFNVFLYFFLRKTLLSFMFACKKLDRNLGDEMGFRLWCKCHTGTKNMEHIVTKHLELERQVIIDECCLLCNSFMADIRTMKEVTLFEGHFSDCQYFINV